MGEDKAKEASQEYGQEHWVYDLCRDSTFKRAYELSDPNAMQFFVKTRLQGEFDKWLNKNTKRRVDNSYVMKFIKTMMKGTKAQIKWAFSLLQYWIACEMSRVAQIAAYDGNITALEALYSRNHGVAQDSYVMSSAVWSGNTQTVSWLHEHGGMISNEYLEEHARRGNLEMLAHLLKLQGYAWPASLIDIYRSREQP